MFWFEIGSGFEEPGGTPLSDDDSWEFLVEYNVGWFISVIIHV